MMTVMVGLARCRCQFAPQADGMPSAWGGGPGTMRLPSGDSTHFSIPFRVQTMRHLSTIVAVVLLLILGCGGEDWQAPTQPVSGQVTINGIPPVGALVHLESAAGAVDARNSKPWGKVRADGTFALTTYELDDGAPVGEYIFTIVWPEDSSKPSLFDRLGRRYASSDRSPYRVTVREGGDLLPAIAMTNVSVTMTEPKGRGSQPSPFDVSPGK